MSWNAERWPNFSQKELSCPDCGLFIENEHALDCLQKLRNYLGEPLTINSATRCAAHNFKEGGAPKSEHLNGRAFDIAIGSHDKTRLYWKARVAGFQGFGFGSTFLHVDTGAPRRWDYGEQSKQTWKGIMP